MAREHLPLLGGVLKSLMVLWQVALKELGARCCTSTAQDLKTVLSRSEHEGLSFLTITLPTFGDDFQKSLDRGYVDRSLFHGFSWKGGLPRFLGGFLDHVFDRGTGCLVENPSIDAIYAIRQLTLMFGKILVPCSEERVAKTIDGYFNCEQIVRDFDERRSSEELLEFRQISNLLWRDVMAGVDEDIYYHRVIPKHGPGKTADRLDGNAKYDQSEWTQRLEAIFPSGEYLLPSWRYFYRLDDVHYLEPGAERPVRVVAVPKTLKRPRIIALEPTCMQYMQQALFASVERHLKHDTFRWLIDWGTQVPNQELAQEGSLSGELATLDLSDASDRVSNQLVRAMTQFFPNFAEGVDACRSRKADVFGKEVRLAKFASMGSALCFPIETMVFASIVFLGIQDELKRPLTRDDVLTFRGKVRLYGDDIIVPVEFVRSVVRRLEAFGLKVNADKSFWTGRFRESCGKEFYDGEDVSIVRVRRKFYPRQMDAQEKVSLYSLRNQFYLAGMWGTARFLDEWIVREFKLHPTVSPSSPVLGRWSVMGYETHRTHPDTHSPLVKGFVVDDKIPTNSVDDLGALMKVLLSGARKEESNLECNTALDYLFPSTVDPEHLLRSGRPVAVDIKRRYGSPF